MGVPMDRLHRCALAGVVLFAVLPGFGQAIDPAIAAKIASVRAIDDHAHPVLSPPEDATDRNFDALPVDDMEAATDPISWRPDFPALAGAWKALFGFDGSPPLSPEGLRQLDAARARVKQEHGTGYGAWVLDQAGDRNDAGESAERWARGWSRRGFAGWRMRIRSCFRWTTDGLERGVAGPEAKFFRAGGASCGRSTWLRGRAGGDPPATLDDYVRRVVVPTLERQRAGGAVAEKFEVAYLRSFDFSDPTHEQAAAAYARLLHQASPDPAEYKLLQDFLFRYMARECGRLGWRCICMRWPGVAGIFRLRE